MATYGFPNSQLAFTGWSPTLGAGVANQGATVGAVQFNGLTQQDDVISGVLNNQANRKTRALLYALLGVAAGGVANAPYTRVLAQQSMNNPFALGGLVPIETTTYINRNTLANDVTQLQALLNRQQGTVAYPIDLSMNGGSAGIGGPNSKVLW